MPINDLLDTFEGLNASLTSRGDYLRQDETRTRQVLIDPLLRALGWDVADPEAVELECRIPKQYAGKNNKADYAFKSDGKPVAFLEAKALGKDLVDDATIQVLNYANASGVPYMIVSDGNVWRMFDVFKPLPLNERILMDFEVGRDHGSICALRSLAMWHPNIRLNRPPESPIVPVLTKTSKTRPRKHRWIGINDSSLNLGGANQPIAVSDHVGKIHEVSTWAEALFTIASQLALTGKLTAEMCPVQSRPTNKRYLVHTEPFHRDGQEFKQPECIQGVAPELFLEMNASAKDKVKIAIVLLKVCNEINPPVDASKVKFGFPTS